MENDVMCVVSEGLGGTMEMFLLLRGSSASLRPGDSWILEKREETWPGERMALRLRPTTSILTRAPATTSGSMAEWLKEELRGELMDVHVLMPGGVYTPLIARNVPDPKDLPPEMGVIMPDRCAEIALKFSKY